MKHYSSKEVKEAVGKRTRELTHPNLRDNSGNVCEPCSQDFTHNQALQDLLKELGIKE